MDDSISSFWPTLEALGTVAAVVLALLTTLWFELLKPILFSPNLDIKSIKMSSPDCFKIRIRRTSIQTGQPKIVDSYYLRFRVINKGREKAENVEVFASKLTKLQANGSYEEVTSFLPMHLTWSFYPDIFISRLSPDMFRHCDIAYIINPKDRRDCVGEAGHRPDVEPDETVLSFSTIDKPHSLCYLQEPGRYRLTVVIAASNSKPVERCLDIYLRGEWFDDEARMLPNAVGVQVLDSGRKTTLTEKFFQWLINGDYDQRK